MKATILRRAIRARVRIASRNIAKRSCSITIVEKSPELFELRTVSAVERSPAHTGAGGRIMSHLTGKLAVLVVVAGALAMPAYAAPQQAKAGGGGHAAAAHAGGGARAFGGGGIRSAGRIGGG